MEFSLSLKLSKYKTKYKSLILGFSVSAIDQIVLSGIRFLTSLFLIKTTTKNDFGDYSLLIPVTLLVTSIQNALISTPMLVLYYNKTKLDKQEYINSLLRIQMISIIILFTLNILIFLILFLFKLVNLYTFGLSVAVSIAVIGLLSQQLIRNFYFVEELPKSVLKIDIYYFLTLFALSLISYFVIRINVSLIFVLIGLSSFLVSILQTKRLFLNIDFDTLKKHYKENWLLGKWALFGVIVTHVQTYGYIYLIGLLVNSTAVADISAARLLMVPISLIQTGWEKIAIPHGSKLRENNKIHHFSKEQMGISIIFSSLVIIYMIIILLIPEQWKNLILSKNYSNAYKYIIFYGALYIAGFFALNASYGLQVLKKFDVISKFNFYTMFIVLIITYLLIKSLGISGGLIASIIGQVILAVGLWMIFYKLVKNSAS